MTAMASGPIRVGDEVVNLQMPGLFRVVARRGALLEIETAQGVRMTVRPEAVRRLDHAAKPLDDG
jgi:hypothetical protein